MLGADDSTYTLGKTDGYSTHTLLTSELPKKEYSFIVRPTYFGATKKQTVFAGNNTSVADKANDSTAGVVGTASYSSNAHDVKFSNGGEGKAFSTMPPYLAVYIWKRTA